MTSILGIDLAWKIDNLSAISVAEIYGKRHIHITEIIITNWQKVLNNEIITKSIIGIAIDAPLIIYNDTGKRKCEELLSREYGGRGASCHSTNLARYPDHPGVRLSHELMGYGFEHLNCKGNFQIECYPHPALIEIFSLDYRLKYKNGLVSEKKDGQCKLSSYIRRLENSAVLKLTLAEETMRLLQHDYIHSLGGNALKQNEDALDSIICAYIAGLFFVGFHSGVFGSVAGGYIYVPDKRCV